MSFLDYNQNIPGSQNNPSDDQPLMRTNTNSTRTWVTIDHFGFKDNQGGYHKIIHQPPQVAFPAPIANIGQLFVKNYTPDTDPVSAPDTQLFFQTGKAGGLSQLTGNNALSEGYQWIGGVLVQWGGVVVSLNSPIVTGFVDFQDRSPGNTIPFPNNLFMMNATLFVSGVAPTTAGDVLIDTANSDKTKFTWYFRGSATSNYTGFWWMAIGN